MRRFIIDKMPPFFLHPPLFWPHTITGGALAAPAARPVHTTEAVMTERRWATALSRASTELTVMFCTRTLVVLHEDGGYDFRGKLHSRSPLFPYRMEVLPRYTAPIYRAAIGIH